MDGREGISLKMKQGSVQPTITAAFASAFLEWILIFLLFVDAFYSYLVTKFASYCQLQIPCVLCSRLDHVLGKEKAGFYWDLICKKHKLQISSVVHCKLHNNLVDVHGICENCLFSFATVNKSNAETYRLLVGKLGNEPHVGLDDDPLLAELSALDGRKCSCCHQEWVSRGQSCMLFRARSYEATELDAPLLAKNIHVRDELEETRDVSSRKILDSWKDKNNIDPLPHIEYEKVKTISDTESEAPFVDDASATELFCVNEQGEKDLVADYQEKDLSVDCLGSEKLIDTSEPLVMDSEVQVDSSDLHTEVLTTPAGHGLEELNWQQVEDKTCVAAPSEMISFSDVIPSSDVNKSSVCESRVNAVGISELEKDVKSVESADLNSNSALTNAKRSDVKSCMSDASLQMPCSLELGDAYKLAIGSRGRQLSGKLLEQKSVKDSARLSEDLKLLLSQLSAARGIELPLFDISPRVSGNVDELKASDASSCIGMQILQKRISLERNESGISLDGSIVSEIEGESAIDRLKRQVEHDKNIMLALYKELEEERNASAVAANQAMAMITRLQEEKAALHMEALQCVRMLEEQEDYDVEALQKANEILAEKEKEIQDLESELEVYRETIGDLPPIVNLTESNCGLKIGGTMPKQTGTDSAKVTVRPHDLNTNVPESCSEMDELVKCTEDDGINVKSSQPDFEQEALLILQCLRKLEKKLQLFSSSESYLDIANQDDLSVEDNIGATDNEVLDGGKAASGNDEAEVDHSAEHVVLHEASIPVSEISVGQYEEPHQLQKGSDEPKHAKHTSQNAQLEALRNEFHALSGRLEALEAEHSFLEHSINSLSRGGEGLKFIQEIACQVRELHYIGIKRRS